MPASMPVSILESDTKTKSLEAFAWQPTQLNSTAISAESVFTINSCAAVTGGPLTPYTQPSLSALSVFVIVEICDSNVLVASMDTLTIIDPTGYTVPAMFAIAAASLK